MAAIQCPGCKAQLSVKGLVNCPLCQTYLNPPHHQAEARAAARETRAILGRSFAAKVKDAAAWFAIVAMGVVVLGIAASILSPSTEKTQHSRMIDALARCQHAIQATAQYGDAEMPPYVPNYGRADEFYFAWPPGSFHFTNGFGARVKMSASCIGRISTGEIQHLTINGKDIP